jgi:hypothetical protein
MASDSDSVGSNPSGHQGDDNADGEKQTLVDGGAQGIRHPEKDEPCDNCQGRDQPHRAIQLLAQGGRALGNLPGKPGYAAQPSLRSSGDDQRGGRTGGNESAGENDIPGLQGISRGRGLDRGGSEHGFRFAGERRQVNLQFRGPQHPGISRDTITLFQ